MSRPFLLLVPLLLLAVVASGCAGDTPETRSAPTTGRSTPPAAPAPNVTEETGSIAGVIVDEEERPILRATVSLLEAEASIESDESGAFTFNDLAPKKYSLVVERVGYDQAARKVEVKIGEVTDVRITLTSLAILEAFTFTYDRTAYIGVGNVFLQDGTWLVNNSAVNSVVCEPCQFVNHVQPAPQDGMTEALFIAGQTGVPYVNADAWIIVKHSWTTGVYADGTNIAATYFSDRERVDWAEGTVKGLAKVDTIMIQVHGGVGLNVQHRIQIFNTLGYNGLLPDGFSALPPK